MSHWRRFLVVATRSTSDAAARRSMHCAAHAGALIRIPNTKARASCWNRIVSSVERMNLTLWRGDQLLGALRRRAPSPYEQRPRPGKPSSITAVLIPAVPGTYAL